MKKIVMVCMALILIASMSLSVVAATGGFMSSPSGRPAPELVSGKNSSESCKASVSVTAYGDRHMLTEESRLQIEAAYASIVGTADVGTLSDALPALAEAMGVQSADLAVSDLFDISATKCDEHASHGAFGIKLKAEALDNFVTVSHYYNGAWSVIENVELVEDEDGEKAIEFSAKELSPFAIVVSTQKIEPPAKSNVGWIVAIIIIAVVAAGVATWYVTKKIKKPQQ